MNLRPQDLQLTSDTAKYCFQIWFKFYGRKLNKQWFGISNAWCAANESRSAIDVHLHHKRLVRSQQRERTYEICKVDSPLIVWRYSEGFWIVSELGDCAQLEKTVFWGIDQSFKVIRARFWTHKSVLRLKVCIGLPIGPAFYNFLNLIYFNFFWKGYDRD